MTDSDWKIFRTAHAFFKRRLTRSQHDVTTADERILDLGYLVQISWHLRRFQDAESALEELLDLTANANETSDTLVDLRIRELNWMACLQANYREPGIALQTALTCIESCEVRLKQDPGNRTVRSLLSLALRNVGVIEEVLGRNGTPNVKRAVDIAASLLETDASDHPLGPHASLVDLKQMLGFLYLRHARHEEALATWIDALSECQKLVLNSENAARQQLWSVPVLRLRKARRRLKSDVEQLKLLSSAVRNSVPHSTGTADRAATPPSRPAVQWAWTPLKPGDGLSELAIDHLVTGTLPGEFEPQEATLVSWPADNSWAHSTMLEMLPAINETMPVVVLVPNDEVRQEAVETISAAGISLDRIDIFTLETNTVWARDYGPLTVKCDDGTVRIACSMFKDSYADAHPASDFVPAAWSRATGWPMFRLPVLIEAGALLSNGDGLCLSSEYLLAKNADSGIGEQQVTASLKRLTGADQVVYLQPLLGEETGHVDWFAVFTSADTVVIGDYYGLDAVNAQILDNNARRLSSIKTRKGPLQVERIPMPPRGKDSFGGTYTNVVFANGNLLVPTWLEASRKHEEKALSVYRRLLPDWKIIPIDSQEFGQKQGSLRCATMNLYRYRPPQLLMGSDS